MTENEVAAEAMDVARQRIEERRMLRYPSCVLPLRDLLAFAWLCGAIDVLLAQRKIEGDD